QIILYKYEGGYISSAWNTGDGVATREQIVLADSVIRNDTNNSVANWIYGLDILTKFDDKVFEPILLDGLYAYKAIGSYGDTDIEFQILYAAKSDGTGWIS